jgi:DUF1680 family protein
MKATPTAGTFHAIRRSWKSGDKLEFEIDQPIRTEQVDAQTPERVAVLRGSQVMFALASEPPQISNKALQIARRGNEFSYAQGNNSIPLRPFWQIKDEIYQTYWKVRA